MPTDPNGTYNLPASYFVELGDTVDPDQHNPPLEDIGQGLTDRMMRDGRAPMTGDLDMDGNKIEGLANGTAAQDAATVFQSVPPGAVMSFARNTAPNGWLACSGQNVSRTDYAGLFAAIGTTFGSGNGTTTFGLPDMRGEFIRGWDNGRGVDSGRDFGSDQADENKQHNHSASTGSNGAHTHTGTTGSDGAHSHSASTGSAGSHSHTGTTDGGGSHTHSASTGSNGSHSHSGSTNSAGSHDHDMPRYTGGSDAGNTGLFAGALTTSAGSTSSAGSHSHSLDINSSGSHTHSVSVNSVGNHTHAFSTNSTGSHTHSVSVSSAGAHTHGFTTGSAGAHTHSVSVGNSGGAESRPRNIALLYCIKA